MADASRKDAAQHTASIFSSIIKIERENMQIRTPEGFKIHERETGDMKLRTSFAGALIEDLKVFV